MNVGIIVYSKSGYTLSVAEKLEQALRAKGHSVSIDMVVPVDEKVSNPRSIELRSAPDVSPYDAIVFASPVQAFSLAPVMKEYMSQISQLNGKVVSCFVTQSLMKPWMGGNRAVSQITTACKDKGADIQLSDIVNRSSRSHNRQIADIITRFSSL